MFQEMLEIELSKIKQNPYQPRKHFNPEDLEDLAKSIQSVGVLHPPVVRKIPGENEEYELIAGERRFRAAEIAGLKKMQVIINQKSEGFSAEAALIENIQRVDLNPLDIAKALKRLIVEFGLRQEQLAEKTGKKRSTITNYLRLLSLPHKIQESLQKEEISMGHAKAILSVDGFEKQLFLHNMVVEEKLSVRESEIVAQRDNKPVIKKRMMKQPAQNVFLKDLEEKLQQRLGTKVAISAKGKRGKILIDFYSLDDLERVLEAME